MSTIWREPILAYRDRLQKIVLRVKFQKRKNSSGASEETRGKKIEITHRHSGVPTTELLAQNSSSWPARDFSAASSTDGEGNI